MSVEGELLVRVRSEGERVTSVTARCLRPRLAARLFPGRAARDVAPLARTLYALCGRSQAIAAEAAIEAIRGGRASEALTRGRERRIAAETLMEHAWRLLVDAPQMAGREPAVASLADARRVLSPFLDAGEACDLDVEPVLDWARGALLGRRPGHFLEMDTLAAFREWTRWSSTPVAGACGALVESDATLGASDVSLMPAAAAWIGDELAGAIDADTAFDDVPQLAGTPRETGPLARTAGHPLVAAATAAWGRGCGARWIARLVDTATALQRIEGTARNEGPVAAAFGAVATGRDAGISWLETARGLLVHRVRLDGERIADYRIVAPTEWNFHPAGAFARGAQSLDAGDATALEAQVRRLVASLDPCVGVRYEAAHA